MCQAKSSTLLAGIKNIVPLSFFRFIETLETVYMVEVRLVNQT